MIAAGEDPRFIARRLIISASEDVGNADPRALQVAVAAAQALDHVGLPEAQYALAQATTYIATAPKSNRSGLGVLGRRRRRRGPRLAAGAAPSPQAANPRMKHHGIGVGYRYPHDFEGGDVEQRYLPEALDGRRYYLPTDQGYEATISERLARRTAAARRPARPARHRRTRFLPGASARRRRPHPPDARGEPQEARRDREARRRVRVTRAGVP